MYVCIRNGNIHQVIGVYGVMSDLERDDVMWGELPVDED